MRITLRLFAHCRRSCLLSVSLGQQSLQQRFMSSSVARPRSRQDDANDRDGQKRIHVLGMGNIGTFIAHGLQSMPRPPKITLMLHRPQMYEEWNSMGRRLILQRHGLSEHKFGFDVNWQVDDGVWYSQQSYRRTWLKPLSGSESDDDEAARSISLDESPIDHLVVSTKAMHVVKSLTAVRHRLSPESTIVFLHNGMGVLDEVNKTVFPDPQTRPSYITGIVSHGLYRSKYFNVIHKGVGTTILGVQYSNPRAEVPPPEAEDTAQETPDTEATSADKPADQGRSMPSHIPPLRQIPLAPSASYLLRTFARASVLVPHITNSIDVQLFQLEKLAANALINPLTVINDCTNGHLLGSDAITRVQRLLLYEISGVIGALPELQSVPGIKTRFAPERLLALSRQIIHKTARNTSSMLQDVARGTTTEIDYINGYFVRRGEEVGIACALNYMLVNLVKGKAQIMERGKEAEIPLDTSDEPDM